ncbi:peptidylprolyl isomerase [Nitratidesulfovibrio liaohensis]|uniref:Peptidyl-prolyl cis-trans isomerase n=1 Tax=Nitratidesulfovibrio liaohensis TaxID=2604158 RepID=A0ABY9QZZ5_9BACT|nr:peptidylprolyl isomerase [Nitratidesulfovibrio liaohensis]WMW64308.1 peptidyl-prolyl cis-trans isomerase [Nitratidesulfovibrio liaohensis]
MSNPVILLETSSGDILIELDAEKAPATVANFLSYVDSGFYKNTIFHRVIKDFMIQGGGLSVRMEEKPTNAPVRNEANNGLKNLRGTIAMARTADPHSAAAQFFINTVDNADLDHTEETDEGWGYCVFGQVIEGMDTVDKIQKLKIKPQGIHTDAPADMVVITGVSRFE